MGWLTGCRAIVTGGARGIGRAVARRFLAEGASVVVFDRDVSAWESSAAHAGASAVAIQGSVASWDDNRAAVARCIEVFGGVDVFVGNAGVFDFFRPLCKLQGAQLPDAFHELFEVNVMGYLLGARAALDALRASHGCMIFTASNASFHAGGGGPLYVASKHAVVGLVRQLAYELAPDIRVNGVAPGGTMTALAGLEAHGEADRHLGDIADVAANMAAAAPLALALQPEDHTAAYVLLAAAQQSRAMTGTIIRSDGGWEVRRPLPRGA